MAKYPSPHPLNVEPLEDRLLLATLSAFGLVYPTTPVAEARPATAASASYSDDTSTPDTKADDSYDYSTPSQSAPTAAAYPAAGSATAHASPGQQTAGQAAYLSYASARPANVAQADPQEAARAAQAYNLQVYCMEVANATAAARAPVDVQRTTVQASVALAEQAASQARLLDRQVQDAAGRAEAPPTSVTLFAARAAAPRGPDDDLVALAEPTTEAGEEPAAEGVTAQVPADGRPQPSAELLAGRLPLDLAGLQQRVQQFFEQLAELTDPAASAPVGIRLAPWFVAVAVATSACEFARRQLRKQPWPGPIPGIDPASRTWTWLPEPPGEPA
jgi:hypothetical protein